MNLFSEFLPSKTNCAENMLNQLKTDLVWECGVVCRNSTIGHPLSWS